jgi:pimeloyl-ACP methyl ester carboxylesterase
VAAYGSIRGMAGALHTHLLSPGVDGGGRVTVVLLHGLTDSGACWPDAVRRWVPRGWRLLAPDARGHGSSPRWDDAELARRPGTVMTEDVVALLEREPADRPVVLLGHSMGAAVAVAAAATVPRRVAAVVAEDPPWPLPPHTGPDPKLAREFLTSHAGHRRTDHAARVARQREEAPGWPEAELGPWSRAKDQVDERLLATGDIVPPAPWPALLAVLAAERVPVLVVTGDGEGARVVPEAEAEAVRQRATVVRVPGAGHCVRRDQPERYHRAVEEFLGTLGL